MKIVTAYDPPPIPMRQFDWSAIDDLVAQIEERS